MIYKENLDEEIEKLEKTLSFKNDQKKSIEQGQQIRILTFLYEQIEKVIKNKAWYCDNFATIKTSFLDNVDEAKKSENNLLSNNQDTQSTLNKLNIDINKINNDIRIKKTQKKTAEKRDDFPKYKDQSKTDENYMDYNQDTNGNENKNMERKVFLQMAMG